MDRSLDKKTDTDDKNDELSQNYQEMDETGKEELGEILEKIHDFYNTVFPVI